MEMLPFFHARSVSLLCAVKTKVQPQQNPLPGTYQPTRLAVAGLGAYQRHVWGGFLEKWLINASHVTLHQGGLLGSTSTAAKEPHFCVPT